MALSKLELEIILKSRGIKPTTDAIKKLREEFKETTVASKKVSDSSNKLKRNLEGVAQRSGSTAKDFSRMQQGMGGLVQIYATVAANVFALSSAFLVLRRAADLSSMVKSAEDFSNRFGVSVTRITKRMQEATHGALSFAEALPTINKGISAGLGEEQMTQLAIAATKAAQTFGGSTTEALNRFISASQRGRVEIIQTLGIIIKTEQAYKDYGATIGKTALELSAFDRQQAIVAATIAESQNVFDGVAIDPNPFQVFLTTLTDLKDIGLTLITDFLTPFINKFNQFKTAAAALITILVSGITKRLVAPIGERLAKQQQESIASTSKATAALKFAKEQETRIILVSGVKQVKLNKEQLLQRSKMFDKYYADKLKQHKTFGKSILTSEKELNAAILNERRAAITKELNARAGIKGKENIAFQGIPTQVLDNERNRLILLTKETKNATAATAKLTMAEKARAQGLSEVTAKMGVAYTKMRADLTSFSSQYKTGFAKSFAGVSTNFVLSVKNMGRAWSIFVKRAIIETRGAQTAFEAFGRAVGRTVGFVSGAFLRAFSLLSTITVITSVGFIAWSKYGDSIRGITTAQRAVIEATKEFKEELIELNKRTSEGIIKLGEEAPRSLKKLRDALQFTAGTFSTLALAIDAFRKTAIESLGDITPQKALERMVEIEDRIKQLKKELNVNDVRAFAEAFDRVAVRLPRDPEKIEEVKKLEKAYKDLAKVIKELAKSLTTELSTSISKATKLAAEAGFQNPVGEFINQLRGSDLELSERELQGLFSGIISGGDALQATLDNIKLKFGGNNKEFVAFADKVLALTSAYSKSISTFSNSNARSLLQLEDTNSKIGTYISGLDKALAAAGPNKEINAFVLDINRELENLKKNQKDLKSTKLADLFGDPEELSRVKSLLGFAKDEIVTIEKAQKRGLAVQDDLVKQTLARLVGSEKLKTLSIQQGAISSRELRSDEERVKQAKDLRDVQIEITKQKLLNLQADIAAQGRVILSKQELGASETALKIDREKLSTMEQQEIVLTQELASKVDTLKVEEVILDIRKQQLDSQQKVNASAKQINSINLKLSETDSKHLIFLKEAFKLDKRALTIKKQSIENELRSLEIKGIYGDLNQREINELAIKLELIKAQTRELERQQLLISSQELEASGVTIFSELGLAQAAKFFIREVRDQARGLKTTFQILGQGFVKVINDTFDTMVTNLLEGGKDFGRTVIETIKTGLREIIGEALQTKIRDAFSQLFIGPAQDPNKDLIVSNTTLTATLGNTNAAIAALNATMIAKTGTGAVSIKTIVGTTEGTEGIVNNLLPGLEDIKKEVNFGNDIMTGVKEDILEGNNITREGFLKNLLALGKILFSLAKDAASGIGNFILKIFGGATGGMLPGRAPIAQFAQGGITQMPQLALIGEGKRNEAVVPLPNNREIPVDLKGASGDTIQINQTFDFTNTDSSAIPRLRAEARAIEDRTFNRVFTEINKGGRYAKVVGRR